MNHFSIELNCLKLVQIIVQIANLNCLLLAFSIEESPPTLEYLITVQHLLNVHNVKLDFMWLAKKDNLMLLNQFKAFSINLNAQHVSGMTPFDLALNTVIRYSNVSPYLHLLALTLLHQHH